MRWVNVTASGEFLQSVAYSVPSGSSGSRANGGLLGLTYGASCNSVFPVGNVYNRIGRSQASLKYDICFVWPFTSGTSTVAMAVGSSSVGLKAAMPRRAWVRARKSRIDDWRSCGTAVSREPSSSAAAPVGLLSKVIADVARKETGKEWQAAHKGEMLSAGDRVRTGERSVAVIKFIDNSLIRVREHTEVLIHGSMSGSTFSKSVEVQMGVIGFTVQKQRPGEEFRFSSPTSVASIRGTGGALAASPAGDTLTVLDGVVNFANVKSSRSLDVPAGSTGISLPGGDLVTRASTPEERRRAEEALLGEDRKTLELELRDSQGRSRRLKIEYRNQ